MARQEDPRRPRCGSPAFARSTETSWRSTAWSSPSTRDEFFTMLGPSGSGKTTCLRMIAGFERPDEGVVELEGRDVTGVPPFERDVNTVFQDYALFPHMTRGRERGVRPARSRRSPKDERRRRAGEALELVRLGGYEERRTTQLSGGQRQRVALARALVNRPARAAARRAARRARPEAPPADAARAAHDPGRGGDHLRLRDPRPGGGAHDERPPGRLQRGPRRAGGRCRRTSTSTRPTSSWPASSACRTSWSATAGG